MSSRPPFGDDPADARGSGWMELGDALLPIAGAAISIVVDESPSMGAWDPTITAFCESLKRHGAFGDVREFRLGFDPSPRTPSAPRIRSPGTGAGDPESPVAPTAPEVILILTDGLHGGWRGRAMARLLTRWGGSHAVAIVNPYPQAFWHRGQLVPRRVRLHVHGALDPNALVDLHEVEEWSDPFTIQPTASGRQLAIPYLELSPRWLRWWAALIATPPSTPADATAYVVEPRDNSGPEPIVATDWTPHARSEEGARDLVLRFRSSASPTAFQLATYFAAAPLDLPFLRGLQRTVLPESTPVHLAEVLTSVLLRYDNADHGSASQPRFADGVREALLAGATRHESARVVRAVAEHYGGRNLVAAAMTRVLAAPDLVPDSLINQDTVEFARIELAVLRALSGPYVQRALRLGRSIAEWEEAPPPIAEPIEPAAEPEKHGETMPTPPEVQPPNLPDERDSTWSERDRPITEQLVPLTEAPMEPFPDPADDPEIAAGLLLDDSVGGARPVVWGNVPPRNQFFTGRRLLLQQLEQRLRTERLTAVLPQALHGMGGVGKSQVVIEYSYRHRVDYDVVWWIPSEQPAQILSALIELGERLGLDVGPEANTAVPAVLEALAAGVPFDNWLLVFDNAENLDAVRDYLPDGGPGRVLVTSRNADWSRVAETLEVDVFTRPESIRLLQRRNPDISAEDADQLAEALGDLPLAVEQAATWRATTGMAAGEYLRLLQRKRAELLDLPTAPGYELPVAAAWNVALDRLGVENPAALQLLQVLSFFAPEPIARDLLTGPRNAPIAEELDNALQSPSNLGKAIRDIQRYGLARVDHRTSTVQLHRLVKVVLFGRMSPQERVDMEHGAHVLLAGGNPGAPDSPRQWPRYQELVPHVTMSNAIGCADAWARELVLDIIVFHYFWGDFAGCHDLSQIVVDQWREQIGPDDPQTLRAAKWLGYISTAMGALRQAAEINADCLERLERTVGPDDEETLDAMSMVAATCRAAGDFRRSLSLDQETFDRCRPAFGEDDPTTLRAAHNLAISLRLHGEFRAALELDTQTYRRRVAVLGDQHPLTLMTLNGLTLDQRECGAYIKAHAVQERVYEKYQTVFGINHPNCIIAARNLAVARRRAGNHEQAHKLAEDTFNRFQQRFGPTHHDTIAAALNLAVDLRVMGFLERARALAEQTLAHYHNALGAEHPYALYARTNLAIVLRLLGDVEAAQRQDSHAWDALTTLLGPDHVITLTCAINLASDQAALGDLEGASTLDAETLARSRRALGAAHPSTLACELNLSLDLDALGRQEESASHYENALDGFRQVFSASHPATVAAAQRLRANCDADPMPL